MKIKNGDNIKIIAGKDKGKNGKVLRVFPVKGKILVEGINILKKHIKPKKAGEKGQIVQSAMPVAISNAMVICPSCKKPSRIGYKISAKRKVRVCKKCGGDL